MVVLYRDFREKVHGTDAINGKGLCVLIDCAFLTESYLNMYILYFLLFWLKKCAPVPWSVLLLSWQLSSKGCNWQLCSSSNFLFCQEIGTLGHMFLSYRELFPLNAHLQYLLQSSDSSLSLNDSFFMTYLDPIKNNLPKIPLSHSLIHYPTKALFLWDIFFPLKAVSDTTPSQNVPVDYLSIS